MFAPSYKFIDFCAEYSGKVKCLQYMHLHLKIIRVESSCQVSPLTYLDTMSMTELLSLAESALAALWHLGQAAHSQGKMSSSCFVFF